MAIRFERKTPATWSDEVVDRAKVEKRYGKCKGRIMFPTTHDITPNLVVASLRVLHKMLEAGNEVLIVSKPHESCIRVLCSELRRWQKQLMFRFTIGSADNETLSFWESGAPGFSERLWCLRYAFEQGYQTSVSCEPMLDRHVEQVVDACTPYVTDSIWIGKANKLLTRMRRNECTAKELAQGEQLVAWQNDKAILALYEKLRHRPVIKWKESIKTIVGIDISAELGHDS
jgi:DNA repair photolyase